MKHMHNSESYSNLNSQKSKNSRIINDITQQKKNKCTKNIFIYSKKKYYNI